MRTAKLRRTTGETDVAVVLDLARAVREVQP